MYISNLAAHQTVPHARTLFGRRQAKSVFLKDGDAHLENATQQSYLIQFFKDSYVLDNDHGDVCLKLCIQVFEVPKAPVVDIGTIVSKRLEAQRKLQTNPEVIWGTN